MTPREFVQKFKPDALRSEAKCGIAAKAILTQAAVESGWGKFAPGNMFFGKKDTDGINGNEQLITTTEYSRRIDLKFPEIIKVEPVVRGGVKLFKYTVKDYFRKYNTPEDCFNDYAKFFLTNPRYKNALAVAKDPARFFEEIQKAGYATAPNYADYLKLVLKTVEKNWL